MYIIGGTYRKRKLTVPKGDHVRPTSSMLREAVFNICQNMIEGTSFLDLFAGSGAMGLEALSRGAAFATFVEKDREALHCLHKNIEQLKVEDQTQILHGDVWIWLKKLEKLQKKYDIVYADPPYHNPAHKTENSISQGKLIVDYFQKSSLLKEGGSLFVEESKTAFEKNFEIPQLHLKSRRELGRSVLYHFESRSA